MCLSVWLSHCLTHSGHCLLVWYVLLQGAINFAVQSAGAISVNLVLFTESDLAAGKATYEITLDPATNKTGTTASQVVHTTALHAQGQQPA